MKSYPWPITSLSICYFIAAILGISYAIISGNINLFSLGMIPVLAGIYLRADWGLLVLRVYIAIQGLAIIAFATTAVIAWQITPEDVIVQWHGTIIPLWLVASVAILTQILQWFVAFNSSTKVYFQSIHAN
ncbi:hypothetical protein [Shewanella sp. NIFS-20-20]|uniref:hypothetical protein n=1 Tax=Shewanella sp. NIFS-20-20 TaxID=2853806 RepID=UPI001C45F801|nr:hypothetical protein [Shewanella sp. NIFS-20-20]MBV7317540.1 hypothetical protein [Shewanella sp. NIFS-20-20]